MNIGWIFVICALLILVIMALRSWRGASRAARKEKRARENGPDTEGFLPIVEAPGEEIRNSMNQGMEQV